MIAYTLSNNDGTLVEWHIGKEWAREIRAGCRVLPSSLEGFEQIILFIDGDGSMMLTNG